MKTSFTTTLSGTADGPTGIVVPAENVEALGAGKKPAIKVTVSGYSYPSTVAVMGGKFMIPFAAEHRKASGIKAGDAIEVTLELETQPRVFDLPEDLAAALKTAGLRAVFDAAAPSKRKEWVRQVTEAKAAETRARRVEKVVAVLSA
jgi:bifunctional DNA-binding transcriptional regulator/antitoxin component of YhaV-PrlF toxin-antitoxin module